MNFGKKTAPLFFTLLIALTLSQSGKAQEYTWRERMTELVYTPRYFGPNAFPIPELRSGRIGVAWELEARGEYHVFKGDRTKDIFVRAFMPIANGKAGVDVNYIIYEYYNTTWETVEERHTAGTYWPNGAHGDVVVSFFVQALQSEKWIDMMFEGALKTASGNRLVDARFTDAATYWFTGNIGRNLFSSKKASVRLQGFAGFYCWMTNDLIHRQNDALIYSFGLSGSLYGLSLNADFAGFYGYKNNGDRPQQLRSRLNYEYRKNILSLRFKHGMRDALYNSYSVAYIRLF